MRKAILFILLALPVSCFAQEKDVYTIITLYNAAGLRPASFLYSAELSAEKLVSKGADQTDQGLSLNYEVLGKKNYIAGLKYYRTVFPGFPILYVAVQPSIYGNSGQTGFNARPEIGFLYDPIWQYTFGLRLKLSYGYDIPVINDEGFVYNRSLIEFKIGITFNAKRSTSY